MAVWQIRAGANAALADFALEHGVIAIGWDDVPDLKRFDSRGELKQVLGRVYVNESLHAIAIWAGELWRFANSIRQNDIVFMPRQDRRYLAVGTDVGPYEYRADFPQGARHTRGITWLQREFPRTALPPPMRRSVKARLTVAQVGDRYAAERMRRLLTGYPARLARPYQFDVFEYRPTKVVITAERYGVPLENRITPQFLQVDFIPFFIGLDDLNRVIQDIHGREPTAISIRSLTQSSPVNISLEGVVRETLDVLREVIVPWRRKHARERAELERRKLEAEIKSIETVRKVTEAKALRAEAEAGLALAESRKFQEETRAQAIANHRAELALNESQVDVARRIVDKLAPNAKPEERLRLLTGLHPPTKALCDSSVAIEFPDR